MNRVIMCTGDYAQTPYYFDKVYVKLYSIEELCFVLYENAFLIDKEIMTKPLVEWIDLQCHLPELARELYPLLNQNASVSSFVGRILDYVGYYSKDEIEKAESILRMNVSMNVYEKWKAKADFLYENKHYVLALKEYRHVLESLPEEEVLLRSKVLNNMGVAYMGLLLYDSAEKCFLDAYHLDNNELAYRHYLTVKRMELKDEDYIKLIAERESAYRVSLTIESDMEQAKEDFAREDINRQLKELFELKDQKDAALYYSEIASITDRLKEDYRDIVIDKG